MKGFFKNENCPASQEIVDLQTGRLGTKRSREVRFHLSSCDFCEAEADLYEHFPVTQDEPPAEPSAIPTPLLELAEALFKNRDTGMASLDALFLERSQVN
jgi:hypothetical protein